ncbi:DegT/DnrJ/EryC1/StrS family aminotransferase [Adhaeribacter soli]|uniref:DegT/DnrJ/EryC1/StrS family aminotransferase n=1 Tax=Adhaeribacter soli TaxID=2607655 RepID=A0A5N1IL48_9BACT|nr:DegT/DnrJ/EryC1/StrS family aminotransferase [Adhaeribacter soli]KAA9327411.1 DegT/DnrJ/EryC1/StrS family aminotransferase [Adhaeribacter soli]
MVPIQMVDLKSQYLKIKNEVDAAIAHCLETTAFINGPQVKEFAQNLEKYLGVKHVIPCANGTDALQIAMMALGLKPGDEVIVPTFTYVATAEVIALLGLTPVMVECDLHTFNVRAEDIETAITDKTKAIVPVHLFGQCADMEPIMALAEKHNLFVIEDTAQALGAEYTFSDGKVMRAGTIGSVGCTSFFPSKNLGCYGDGGAMYTNDDALAQQIRMIANHGQSKKYYHQMVGVNSRLDTLQAGILNVKLKHLDRYAASRNAAATYYDNAFSGISGLQTPRRQANSTHVFHQYTLMVKDGKRDALKAHLEKNGIPSMVYYPLPLYAQEAFKNEKYKPEDFPVAEALCSSVLSLPIHTEMTDDQLNLISTAVTGFFSA